MSENKYFITSNGGFVSTDELYHAMRAKERPNHKYISREWKNGRWAYEYAQESKKASSSNRSEYPIGQNYRSDLFDPFPKTSSTPKNKYPIGQNYTTDGGAISRFKKQQEEAQSKQAVKTKIEKAENAIQKVLSGLSNKPMSFLRSYLHKRTNKTNKPIGQNYSARKH